MNVNWRADKHNKTHNILVFDAGNPIGPSEEVSILKHICKIVIPEKRLPSLLTIVSERDCNPSLSKLDYANKLMHLYYLVHFSYIASKIVS